MIFPTFNRYFWQKQPVCTCDVSDDIPDSILQTARLTMSETSTCDLDKDNITAKLKEVLATVLKIRREEIEVVFYDDSSVAILFLLPAKSIPMLKVQANQLSIKESAKQIFGGHTSVKSLSSVFGSEGWPLLGK